MSIKQVLNIPKGYKITKFESTEKEIIVNIEAYKNKKAICSNCGEVHTKGYHGTTQVKVRDLPSGGRKIYLNLSKRRYKCPVDKKIYVEEIDWLKKKEEIPIELLKKFTV